MSAVQVWLSTRVHGPPGPQDAADLGLDGRHVGGERVDVEQVALLGAAPGVADHPGGPAGQGDRAVAGILEPPQHEQPDQVAVVQAGGGRVDTRGRA